MNSDTLSPIKRYVPAKRMRRAIAWSAAALLLLFVVITLAIPVTDPSPVTYNGRTLDDWLHSANWEKTDAKTAIIMLGEKAVEPLRATLRLKSPNWVVYNWQKIPFGNRILSRPLQNVIKKQRALECLTAAGLLEPLLPDIVTVAEDKNEFLRVRQMALRYIYQHMPLTTGKSNTLVRLTADPDLGPEAARYLQSFQRQLRDEEIWKTRQLINDRLNAANRPVSDLHSTTNTTFMERRSLWETGR